MLWGDDREGRSLGREKSTEVMEDYATTTTDDGRLLSPWKLIIDSSIIDGRNSTNGKDFFLIFLVLSCVSMW